MFPEDTGNPTADNENRQINRYLSANARIETRKTTSPRGRKAKKRFYEEREIVFLLSFKEHLMAVAHRILAGAQ
jgi:predicted naringenin-chalcone synthase